MNFLAKNNALTIGLAVVVLGGIAYLFFFTGNEAPADVTVDSVAGSPEELYFVSLASQLNTVDFNTGVLSDERFRALVDLKTEILPEVSGRADPFAPL